MPEDHAPVPKFAEAFRNELAGSGRVGRLPSGAEVPCLTFRDYMRLCLYDPDCGYYRSGPVRVGRSGDFYTSPFLGETMGEQLAAALWKLADERFGVGSGANVVDWGGGTGRLIRQLGESWGREGASDRFRLFVVEDHPAHRREAEIALRDRIESGSARIFAEAEAEAYPWRKGNTIVIANELLDAFPVHRVVQTEDGLAEQGVFWDENAGQPAPCLTGLSTPRLAERLALDGTKLLKGQIAEVGLDAADWVAGLYGKLGNALLVILDYGDEAAELTGPHRMEGTLVCYRRHIAHGDPYVLPGEQDITAHVNFTAIRDAAVHAGWEPLWYGTQQRFLIASGVLDRLAAHACTDPFAPVVRRNRQIRQLLLSDGMGELFKVQIFAKRG